jgi:hypothetical protein
VPREKTRQVLSVAFCLTAAALPATARGTGETQLFVNTSRSDQGVGITTSGF